MTLFQSMLVPLDGSEAAARALRCGMGLAARFNAKVHVLSASPKPAPAQEALDRLRVAEEYRSLIVLHQAASYPADAILSALKEYSVELLIMSARGEASETTADTGEIAGHVTRAVIEASPVPVLLLPSHYRERLPWRSAMVPLSGEPAGDEALALAVRLANELGLRVDIVHVSNDTGTRPAALAQYADAPHHEIPARLAEMVRRALPQFTSEQCDCIRHVVLTRGDVSRELLAVMEQRTPDVLVIGWQGLFMKGHASVLKHLLETTCYPVLLVKPQPRPAFHLNVGEQDIKTE